MFQGHHQAHVALLSGTVEEIGGKAATAKAEYNFPVGQLKAEPDVLKFAASPEQGTVSAYHRAVPLFGNRDLAKAAASILAARPCVGL